MVKYAAVVALLSVSVLCLVGAYSLNTTSKHLSATLMKLDDEIDEAHRLTLEAGLTVMEARKASVKEITYLDAWNKGISRTLMDLHNVAVSAQSAVDGIRPVETAATESLQQATVTIHALQTTANALGPVIAHTDALVSDPAITATLANVQGTTGHLDATAADVQQEVHSLTHPTWLHKLWGGLLDVAHVFNPL